MAIQADGVQTGRRDYATPRKFYELACDVTGITPTLDICATSESTKCKTWLGSGGVVEDAFETRWVVHARNLQAWMNCPFGDPVKACPTSCAPETCTRRKSLCGAAQGGLRLAEDIPGTGDWLRKLMHERSRGLTVLALLPNNCRDTNWFHDWVIGQASVLHDVRGRVAFELDGSARRQPGINVCIAVFRPGEPPWVPFAGPVIDWRAASQREAA